MLLYCVISVVMKPETIRNLLRPYIGSVVDDEYCIDCVSMEEMIFNCHSDKYEHLTNCVYLMERHPQIQPYIEKLLKSFTADELNGNNFYGKNIFFDITYHHEQIIKMLVDSGANINSQDLDGLTLIAKFINYGNYYRERLELVKLYLENGASVNFEFTYEGKAYTALSFLLMRRSDETELIKCLLYYGACYDLKQINDCIQEKNIKREIIEYTKTLTGKNTKPARKY